VLLDRNWPVISELMLGELHLAAPSGTPIDLHWQLLNRPDVRKPFALSPGPLLERVVSVELGRRTVPVLDPVDRLLHLCLHATASGGDRLGWVWDVARSSAAELDWDEVVARARSTRTHVPVATMLLRAQRLLGLEVPPGVTRQLVPPTWSGAVRLAQTLDPLERTAGGGSLTEAVGRASLGSSGESVRELIGRQRAGLRRAARGSAHGEVEARSVFTEAGDAEDRRRFFEAVWQHGLST
jgi:hypothetical protein